MHLKVSEALIAFAQALWLLCQLKVTIAFQ